MRDNLLGDLPKWDRCDADGRCGDGLDVHGLEWRMYRHRFLRSDVDVRVCGHGNLHPAADPDPVPYAHGRCIRQGHGEQHAGGNQLWENVLSHLPEWHDSDAYGHPGQWLLLRWLGRLLHRHRFLRGEHDERSERDGNVQEYAREALNARLLTRVPPT